MKKSLNTSVHMSQKMSQKDFRCGHYSVADTLKWLVRDNLLLKTNNIWYLKFIQYAIIAEQLLFFINHLWNSGMIPVADTTDFWLIRYPEMRNACEFVLHITNVKLFSHSCT